MPKKVNRAAAKSGPSTFASGGGACTDKNGEEQQQISLTKPPESQKPKKGKRTADTTDAIKPPPPATKRKYVKKPVINTKQYDYLNNIDSLGKKRSATVCANRWGSLLMARDNRKKAIMKNDATTKELDAMFDCTDLIIPPTAELLEREVQKSIENWKALDLRVIKTDIEDDDVEDGGKSDGGSAQDGSGRPTKERILPPNFDYQCRKKPPDDRVEDSDSNDVDDDKNNKKRKRVISLLDPTQTLDYESELWKVFKSMPTVKEVEHQYALGSSDEGANDGDHDTTSPPVNHGCQNTLSITNTLEKLRRKYTRIDAHSLGRLRVRDRHASLYNYSLGGAVSNDSSLLQLQTTLRFEILKPNVDDLRRGSGPDGNRLEVEMHGSQHTLLDLHHTLVEHASIDNNSGDDDIPAGVFIIEEDIYTHGDVGEAAADSIFEWIGEHNSKQEEKKRDTGMSTKVPDTSHNEKAKPKLKMVPMDRIKLEDLTLRLGVRYTHINLQSSGMGSNTSWDDQSSVSSLYVTSIQTHPISCSSPSDIGEQNDEQSINHRVPIIVHDIWTSSQQSQTHNMCAACNYLPATVATVNDMMTDASMTFPSADNLMGTPLCASCFRELHYQRSDDSGILLQLRPDRSCLKVFPLGAK